MWHGAQLWEAQNQGGGSSQRTSNQTREEGGRNRKGLRPRQPAGGPAHVPPGGRGGPTKRGAVNEERSGPDKFREVLQSKASVAMEGGADFGARWGGAQAHAWAGGGATLWGVVVCQHHPWISNVLRPTLVVSQTRYRERRMPKKKKKAPLKRKQTEENGGGGSGRDGTPAGSGVRWGTCVPVQLNEKEGAAGREREFGVRGPTLAAGTRGQRKA